MNPVISKFILIGLCVFFNLSGCSTTEVVPAPVPSPPVYTQVPHPVGTDLGDLVAIFSDEKAPQDKEFAKNCDANFRKLEGATQSRDEVLEGLRELVKQDPVTYHWCFYSKLLALENDLKSGTFVDQRQKAILGAYSFLAPLARVYATEYHDSRYLRMAIARYQKWSESVFYRKLELTPAGTSELVKASNPFGLWRDTLETVSVLEKYHISKTPEPVKETSKPPEPISSSKPSPITADLNKEPAAKMTAAPPPLASPSPSPAPVQTRSPPKIKAEAVSDLPLESLPASAATGNP